MSNETLPLAKFSHWVKSKPQSVYLNQPVNRTLTAYTWQEVDEQARRMAAYLVSRNLPKGSRIAILSKNCAHWIMADLAIWMAGHVSVPLYPNLNAETIRQILDHSESKLLFVGKLDGFAGMKPGIPPSMECVQFPHSLYKTTNDYQPWEKIVEANAPLKEFVKISGEDLATIIYTSGTTGMPKGVMHSFRAIAFAGANAVQDVGFSPNDRLFSYLPLSHVAERLLIETCSIYTGATIFFAESLDTFKEDLQVSRPTIFLAVPRIWAKFQDGILQKLPQKKLNLLLSIPLVSGLIKKKVKKGLGLDQCRLYAAGAAATPASLVLWFDKLGIRIQEAYAMTENFAYSHYVRAANWKPGTVGQPFPGVQQRIGESQEIQVLSPTNMLGYYKEQDKTAEMFTADGWLRTGDQGEIASDGTLKITGRVKDLFKTSKGKYVCPSPIELKLQVSEYIENVCVVGAGLAQPLALVVLSEYGRKSPEPAVDSAFSDLLKSVNSSLDAHERLHRLMVVGDEWTTDNGVLTPTMKIKRNVVESRYGDLLPRVVEERSLVVWERRMAR